MLRKAIRITIALAASLLFAIPAYAAGRTVLSEPSTLSLLALGLAGVLIGRRFARRPPED